LDSCGCCFFIIPNDSTASLPPLPASCLVKPPQARPSSPRSGRGFLKLPWPLLLVSAYSPSPVLFRFGPRNAVPFLGPPFSWLQGPEPSSLTWENPAGVPDPQLGEEALGSECFLHCMRARHTCRFLETEKLRHFPEPHAPCYLAACQGALPRVSGLSC
jgi:hypothetical protein